MSEPQDADPVGNALGAAQAHEVAVKAGLEQGFFSTHVGQTKPLLQSVDAQHHEKIKGRPAYLCHRCVRRNQGQQLGPVHHQLHLIEQDLLARSPRIELKAKVCLFHAQDDSKLCASVKSVEGEF